jgi:2-polyprenyl-6-hydroxyphenyl methylase/3-demethylubiquinone-9 3-methyltransferase
LARQRELSRLLKNVLALAPDKWGLSWQITPIALTKAVTDSDPAAAKRAFDAMMQMSKIDIAAIAAAHRG